MKAIVDAVVEAANFAYLVHGHCKDVELVLAAEKSLGKLHIATDRIVEMQEGKSEKIPHQPDHP